MDALLCVCRGRRSRIVSLLAMLGVAGALAAVLPARGEAAAPPRCTITGTDRPEILQGTRGRDVICGRGGRDVIIGAGGDDVLRGGAGDDVLVGGAGDDSLDGGPGDDQRLGGAGHHGVKVGDGPPCGPGGPADCRFDVFLLVKCEEAGMKRYGEGRHVCTGETSGTSGFNVPKRVVWTFDTYGPYGNQIGNRVQTVTGGSDLQGINLSPRGPDLDEAVVRMPEWSDATWAAGAWGEGAAGTATGPLYFDVEDCGLNIACYYDVHIFGWLHRQ
jgi:hemolysin type calcium-binding protein